MGEESQLSRLLFVLFLAVMTAACAGAIYFGALLGIALALR